MTKYFIAYASEDHKHLKLIERAASEANKASQNTYECWSTKNETGRPIGETVHEWIDKSDGIIADLTLVNDNVTYEIGYAVGKKIPISLFRSIHEPTTELDKIGLLNSLLYHNFTDQNSLKKFFINNKQSIANRPHTHKNFSQPIYVFLCPASEDSYSQQSTNSLIMSSIKKDGELLKFRVFNINENNLFGIDDAWQSVASSYGIILSWANDNSSIAKQSNQRVALIFGMAQGLGIPCLLFTSSKDKMPTDFKNKAILINEPNTQAFISNFKKLVKDYEKDSKKELKENIGLLNQIDLGDYVAENEQVPLSDYFIETPEFVAAYNDQANVIIGRKGSGKSAIFYQIRDRVREDKNNIVIDINLEHAKMIRFKELLFNNSIDTGTQKEIISVFWEYYTAPRLK